MQEKEVAYNHATGILSTKVDFMAEEAPHLYMEALSAGQTLEGAGPKTSAVFFLIEGSVTCLFPRQDEKQVIGTQEMFFLPAGKDVRIHTDSPSLLLRCTLERYLLLPALRTLPDGSGPDNSAADCSLYTLPVHPLLYAEVSTAIQAVRSFGHDKAYLQHKAIALLQLLLHLYTPEQISRFFAPLLQQADSFREEVLRNYTDTLRVKDLCRLLHIPPTTLNRKFKATFRMSPQQWFAARRKTNLLHDILHTELNIIEISDKYGLSPNYLMKFCKDSFGMTLTQLREQERNKRQDNIPP